MANPEEIHMNDIGTKFLLTIVEDSVPVDISSATTKQIKFKKPSGTTITKTATFETDGTDGEIYYLIGSGDLDEVGEWQLQAYVVITGGTFNSSVTSFRVYENL